MGCRTVRQIPFPLPSRRLRIVAAIAVAFVIFYFSLLDKPPASPPADGGGGLGLTNLHTVAYAGFALSVLYATVEFKSMPVRRLFLAAGIPMVYGVFVELLQAPLPNRYYSTGDMLANAFGVALALTWLGIEFGIRYVEVLDAG